MRLIDFASGLTYALDGGMQRIADKVFLLTPRNVEVSAEARAADREGLLQPVVSQRPARCRSASSALATQPGPRPGLGRSRALHGLGLRPGAAARRELGGEALASNRELAERADLVILAHKPAQLAEVVGGGRVAKAVVSLLARTSQADVRSAYPGVPVFRIEPNTTRLSSGAASSFAERRRAGGHTAARAGARAVRARRDRRGRPRAADDRRRRLLGRRPPYRALLVEARVDAAVKAGMPAAMAGTLVAETMAGAAELIRELAATRWPCGARSPRRAAPHAAGGARARRRPSGVRRRDGRRGGA